MKEHVFTKKEQKQLFKCLSDKELLEADSVLDELGDDIDSINKYFNKLYYQARLSIPRDMDQVMSNKARVRKMDFTVEKMHAKTSEYIAKGEINDQEALTIFEEMSRVKSLIDSTEEDLVEQIIRIQKREKHLNKLSDMINGNSNGFGY